MNRAAPRTDTVCLASFKHDLTGNRPAQNAHTPEFSGSVGHQCAGRCSAIPCADKPDRSETSERKPASLTSRLGSQPCCLWQSWARASVPRHL